MTKLKLLVIGLLFLPLSLNAQRFDKLREAFKETQLCYYGKNGNGSLMTIEVRRDKAKQALAKMESFDKGVEEKYPIYFHLMNHMVFAMDNEPAQACLALKEAADEFEKIEQSDYMYQRDMTTSYQTNLHLNKATLDKMYKSEYCLHYKINESIDCTTLPGYKEKENKQATPKPSVDTTINNQQAAEVVAPEDTKIAPSDMMKITNSAGATLTITPQDAKFVTPNNQTYDSRDGISLIFDLIDRGILNTEHFEIRQLVVGDSRWIHAFDGTPFEIKIKDNAKSVLKFPIGEYTINDGNQYEFWHAYKTGLRDFHETVIVLMDVFGAGAYNILIQGSADAPKFAPKPLISGMDTKFFQEILLLDLEENGQKVVQRTINIGDTYDNQELPQLRGAFLKFVLGHLSKVKKFPNKLHILRGQVTKETNPDDRNCTIVIYINEEKALEHARRYSSKLKKYPKIQLWGPENSR